ncbi:hypothetical protein SAY86_030091 [Trapa natans]|uniref:Uncharacterized protein n=1 Tax=Trapa natans TaxID=22666 RepID=A0AAN7RDG1_TRANT|nr:hypothetical protein SAY86_030091 [Trapa natans]
MWSFQENRRLYVPKGQTESAQGQAFSEHCMAIDLIVDFSVIILLSIDLVTHYLDYPTKSTPFTGNEVQPRVGLAIRRLDLLYYVVKWNTYCRLMMWSIGSELTKGLHTEKDDLCIILLHWAL